MKKPWTIWTLSCAVVIIPCGVLVVTFPFWSFAMMLWQFLVVGPEARKANKNINTAIYAAFRSVETECSQMQTTSESARCARALELYADCRAQGSFCPATYYHQRLEKLGFEMPPLFLSNK